MKDQVSALVDQELSLEESEYLYTAIKGSDNLSECWKTYHLIGDAMRGNPVFSSNLTNRIMQALDAEPAVLAPRKKKPVYKTPVAWSVAASLAAVFFVGWVVLQTQGAHDAVPAEIAQNVASEYVLAHQSMAPSSSAYYIQPAAYSESEK